MTWLLQPSPEWPPYFGNQRRFVPFIVELLNGLGAGPGWELHETNAGSHAVALAAHSLGVRTLANDLGEYSYCLGQALYGYGGAYLPRAARLAAEFCNDAAQEGRWLGWLRSHRYQPPAGSRVVRGDWRDFVAGQSGADILYVDFAWPWVTGEATAEYERTSGGTVPTARSVLTDVLRLLETARPKYRFLVLSNQSSNFPPASVLEPCLTAWGHRPFLTRTLTVPAEQVDNLGRAAEFTEYQYVFRGTQGAPCQSPKT